ncbi:hypothetical protein HFK83_24500 [Ralstonia pseudosolanacearum]|uniref:hypothetical protein n=2 Tax=Ralstonia TaxID=48736 RepID=UPI0004922D21|nr:hypothetical protein [Ralstonia pseudosolanacearum]OAI61665.1 hypothetical protein RSP781_20490 [Ralstonia pseudosolanacearum]QKL54379.1 hypothetical protein HI816_21320 [Ralstonia solanacearum]QKM25631.1 hypothetical protein HI796_21310 [Ralstonia solanacearum]QKM30439.1 hypothetical protein HI795_21320 [Ralstonia solanacearum]
MVRFLRSRAMRALAALVGLGCWQAVLSQPTNAPPATEARDMLGWLPAATVIFVALFFVLGVFSTVRALKRDQNWGLADTLSEKSGTPTATTATPPTGSTSRVIAFLGLIGMLSMFVGIGFYLLWALFNGKQDLAHQLDIAGHYLLYGSALFAPYAFNQIKSVFS